LVIYLSLKSPTDLFEEAEGKAIFLDFFNPQ